jgi:aryl-alcohol dehydrogenase-like predicted oxidoreductase
MTGGTKTKGAPTITIGGDLTVHRLGFGAMRVTGRGIWGPPPDRAGAIALLRRVIERGVDFIDTADSYGPGISEELIAEALHPYPKGLVIATKGGLRRPGPDRWEPDCRPAHLRQACEDSLRRLRLERIDLYQLHTVDPKVPLEESLGALVELQRQGKIRHIGVSNVDVAQLERARRAASVISVQNRYNLGDRASDDVVDLCTRDGLAFLPWYPLGAGTLAGASQLAAIAQRHHATAAQVALVWLLRRSPIVVPIPGTASIAHFEENLGALDVELDAAEIDALTRR